MVLKFRQTHVLYFYLPSTEKSLQIHWALAFCKDGSLKKDYVTAYEKASSSERSSKRKIFTLYG